jgi:hypothetical protein
MQTPLTLETTLLLLEGQKKLLDYLLDLTEDVKAVMREDRNHIVRIEETLRAAFPIMSDAIKTNRDELATYLRSTPDQKGLSHD